jgi:hypothetical protein
MRMGCQPEECILRHVANAARRLRIFMLHARQCICMDFSLL